MDRTRRSWQTPTVPASETSSDLLQTLGESQRLGFLGDRSIGEVIEHARSFVKPLANVAGSVIDLGAGGGVPGLVIAHDRPDLTIVLADRRTKRTDFLRRAVSRLQWGDRVQIINEDLREIIARSPNSFDAAVARGFGPPMSTLSMACDVVRPGGRIVISEPPSGDRWAPIDIEELGIVRDLDWPSIVAVFDRVARETS